MYSSANILIYKTLYTNYIVHNKLSLMPHTTDNEEYRA